MIPPAIDDPRALTLTRLIKLPRAALYRCWTEPALLKQWFCPKPWVVSHAELDVRPGGSSVVVMRGPDGAEMPNRGVYLDVVADARLVSTDAFTTAWVPSDKPFMTAVTTFAEEAGATRYTATALHWTMADRTAHEAMGFHEGWGIATDQLEALAATL